MPVSFLGVFHPFIGSQTKNFEAKRNATNYNGSYELQVYIADSDKSGKVSIQYTSCKCLLESVFRPVSTSTVHVKKTRNLCCNGTGGWPAQSWGCADEQKKRKLP